MPILQLRHELVALEKLEGALFCRRHCAECRTRQGLAIGAIADRNRIRVDFSFVADVATMALAVDLHRFILQFQLLTEPPSTTSDWPVTKSLSLDARNTSAPSRSSG